MHAVLNEKKQIVFAHYPEIVQGWVIQNQKDLPEDYSVLIEESRRVLTIKKYVELSTPVRPADDPVTDVSKEKKAQEFKKVLASMQCVQAGWAFGVPEDGREQWLDLVVKSVMDKYS